GGGGAGRGGAGGVVGPVGGGRQALDGEAGALRGEAVEGGRRAQRVAGVGQRAGDVQGGDVDALPGQGQGGGPALAVRRAGDQGHAAGQLRHGGSPRPTACGTAAGTRRGRRTGRC